MTKTAGTAAEIARTYVEAMANKDVETIVSISSNDIVCSSPRGRIAGIESFRGFHGGFARMIKKLSALAVYGDDEQAVIVYVVDTHPVAGAIVAERVQVKNGKIASTDVIYDATPFAAVAATTQPH
ncbi:nuclear transport factor 2 family protein [Bradyrhizobium sp. 14AA]